MNKNDVKTKCKYKRWISFFWGSWKYERNGPRAKLTWSPSGVTYFARDPKGFTFTLTSHGTRCVHTSMNLRKNCYLCNFDLNPANKWRRKVIIWRGWLLRSTAVTMAWRHSNVTSANQQLHSSMTSLMGVWTSSVLIRSSKEIVVECKY